MSNWRNHITIRAIDIVLILALVFSFAWFAYTPVNYMSYSKLQNYDTVNAKVIDFKVSQVDDRSDNNRNYDKNDKYDFRLKLILEYSYDNQSYKATYLDPEAEYYNTQSMAVNAGNGRIGDQYQLYVNPEDPGINYLKSIATPSESTRNAVIYSTIGFIVAIAAFAIFSKKTISDIAQYYLADEERDKTANYSLEGEPSGNYIRHFFSSPSNLRWFLSIASIVGIASRIIDNPDWVVILDLSSAQFDARRWYMAAFWSLIVIHIGLYYLRNMQDLKGGIAISLVQMTAVFFIYMLLALVIYYPTLFLGSIFLAPITLVLLLTDKFLHWSIYFACMLFAGVGVIPYYLVNKKYLHRFMQFVDNKWFSDKSDSQMETQVDDMYDNK